MNTRRARMILPAATLLATLLMTGCSQGGGDGAETPTPSAEPSVTAVGPVGGGSSDGGGAPSPTASTDPAEEEQIAQDMAPGDVTPEQLEAVKAYLTVRENAESVAYPDAAAWEAALREVVTPEGVPGVIEWHAPAGDDSPIRQIALNNAYQVQVSVGNCSTNPAYPADDQTVAVQCELVDIVTDQSGAPVPMSTINPDWPYQGERDAPLLVLSLVDGKWIVSSDDTGLAS